MNVARAEFLKAVEQHSPAHAQAIRVSLDGGMSLSQATHATKVDVAILLQCWAEVLRVPFAQSLNDFSVSAEFLTKIPIAFARRHLVVGLVGADDGLMLALGDPDSWQQLEVTSRFLGRPVKPMLSPPATITAAINQAYQQRTGQAQAAIDQLEIPSDASGPAQREDLQEALRQLQESSGKEDLLDVASRAPVIKLVNLMLFEAVKAGASDVHVQPSEQKLVVRMRIDGILYNTFELSKSVQEEVVGRVKVMGRMNIAEKRLAQDGRATVQVGDRTIDLRLASLPTNHGERVVIRLLDKSARLYRLDELGMPSVIHDSFRRLIGLEHGLVLVTGPTGSGKSTTLYAALKEIDAQQHNILTLEDPIEYQLEGISQTQVSDKKGMTFAGGLRSVLRQDPDIIMVGEIRDRETATMAIQSALTGHLVFSTLHTNDAASAVTRLLDLGIEPYLVASSVVGVLAQRLVRRICSSCQTEEQASVQDRHWLGQNGQTRSLILRRGKGCDSCRSTGYRGRLGIFELLTVDSCVQRQIQGLATASQIKQAAVASGMRSMRDAGIEKVLAGITTIEEVERVTMRATGSDPTGTENLHKANELTEPVGTEAEVPAPITSS
jgi:general secretion pathway protein E